MSEYIEQWRPIHFTPVIRAMIVRINRTMLLLLLKYVYGTETAPIHFLANETVNDKFAFFKKFQVLVLFVQFLLSMAGQAPLVST